MPTAWNGLILPCIKPILLNVLRDWSASLTLYILSNGILANTRMLLELLDLELRDEQPLYILACFASTVTGDGFVVGGTHQTIPKIFFTSLHVRRMCNQVWLEIPFILMWSPFYKYNAINAMRAPTGSGLCVIRKEASIC